MPATRADHAFKLAQRNRILERRKRLEEKIQNSEAAEKHAASVRERKAVQEINKSLQTADEVESRCRRGDRRVLLHRREQEHSRIERCKATLLHSDSAAVDRPMSGEEEGRAPVSKGAVAQQTECINSQFYGRLSNCGSYRSLVEVQEGRKQRTPATAIWETLMKEQTLHWR